MTARSRRRGHPIEYINRKWAYSEGPQKGKYGKERPCTKCTGVSVRHDVCLGHLEGITAACCGHGYAEDACIVFNNGKMLKGEDVLKLKRIWVETLLAPSEVIAVYVLLEDVDQTSWVCEMTKFGLGFGGIMEAAGMVKKIQDQQFDFLKLCDILDSRSN
jgi:hypothetical protein